ncbi:MAG: TspO/MBR family protein [Rhizobiaceae bacterium]
MPKRIFPLLGFLVLALGGGTLIGLATVPGEWYANLQKPWFNPPNWIFAPVWTLLYVAIAIAGWRTFLRRPGGATMAIWAIQMILNFTWSPAFFGLRMPGLALIVLVHLLAAIAAFVFVTRKVDRLSSLLFMPYLAWVAFATVLNAAIIWLN